MPGQLRNRSSGRGHRGTGKGGHTRTCPQTGPHPGCDVSNLQQKGQHHSGRSCRRTSGTQRLQLRRPQVTPMTQDTLSTIRPHTPNEPTSPWPCDMPGRTAQPLESPDSRLLVEPRAAGTEGRRAGARQELPWCLWVGGAFGAYCISECGGTGTATYQQNEWPLALR